MLTVVTVVESAFFLLTCSLQWQTYHAASSQEVVQANGGSVDTAELPHRGDVQHHRKVQSVTPEYTDRTPSPDFVRHYRNRIRNRESRIVQILVEVSDAVNNGRGNFSMVKSPISESQLDSIKRRFKESAKLPHDAAGDTRVSRTILLPSCGASADDGNRSLSGRTTKDFRIFFNVMPPRRILHPETVQIKSAHLFLRVKPADNALIAASNTRRSKMAKTGKNPSSSKIPNEVLKVKIHSFNAAKLKEKSSPVGEKKEEGKKRRRGRSVAGKKRPLKSVSFDRRNSSEWLKIGLLRAAERWYQSAIRQPGLRVTVVNSKNQRVNPFQIFYDFDCELQRFPAQPTSSTVGDDDEDEGGRADPGSDGGETHPPGSSNGDDHDDAFTFPYLEIVARASPKKKLEVRKQRHLAIQRRNTCHMRPVHVNTEDKRLPNMTNIIAPMHFKSAVCEGFCPRCDHLSSRRSDANQTASAVGCSCRPVKTKSLPVVYDDEVGRVFVRSLPDAVVTKCGCRLP